MSFIAQVFGVDEWATNPNNDPLSLLRRAVCSTLQIKRIGNVSFSPQTISSLSENDGFCFGHATEGGPVFSSRENEAVVARLFLESSNHGALPLDNVLYVRIVNPLSGDRYDLEIDVAKTSPIQWRIYAFMDPSAIRGMANGAPGSNRRLNREAFSFDMIVGVVPADSDQVVELCYTLSWRTVGRMTPLVRQFGRSVASYIHTRLPQPLRTVLGRVFNRKKYRFRRAGELECETIRYAA